MRLLALLIGLSAFASRASAHFVFVVPDPSGQTAKIVLSETLEPDPDVDVALIAKTSLQLREAGKPPVALKLAPAEHAFAAELSGSGPRVVFGSVELGVEQRGKGKPFRLTYHPKTILGD